MELNPSAWIDRDLISGKHHDPFVAHILQERLTGGGVFVDIGANIGVFTLSASKIRDVFVFAFEPSPRELQRLYRNLALNFVNNVVVYPMALGFETGELELSLGSNDNPGANSFVPDEKFAHDNAVALCRCETFDSIFPKFLLGKIKIVKIDVEGFEMNVLRGMSGAMELLGDAAFVVEVTRSFLSRSGTSAEALYAFFLGHGFAPTIGLQEQDQWNEAFFRKT